MNAFKLHKKKKTIVFVLLYIGVSMKCLLWSSQILFQDLSLLKD